MSYNRSISAMAIKAPNHTLDRTPGIGRRFAVGFLTGTGHGNRYEKWSMKIKLLMTFFVLGSLFVATSNTCAEEKHTSNQVINLSPELLELLRAEMQEITTGMQNIVPALAAADWAAIAETSEKIRDSYILERSLTPAQLEKLEHQLPEPFKQLDAEFHQRAAKLGVAAATYDAELVVFHYSRLLDSCTRCHAAYAGARFPGFNPPVQEPHSH